jgi:hypothetical protein
MTRAQILDRLREINGEMQTLAELARPSRPDEARFNELSIEFAVLERGCGCHEPLGLRGDPRTTGTARRSRRRAYLRSRVEPPHEGLLLSQTRSRGW